MAEVPASHRPRAGKGRAIAATAAFFVALAILLSLGTWQVQRLQWKEQLLSDMAERRAAVPVPLADIEAMAAKGEDIEYRPVTVSGVFGQCSVMKSARGMASSRFLTGSQPAALMTSGFT